MSWLQSPLNTYRWMVQHCQQSREQCQTAKFRDENSDLLIAGWLHFMSCCCPGSRAAKYGLCKSLKETKIVMISDFSPNYQLFCASWGYINMSWQWTVKILLLQMYFTLQTLHGLQFAGLWQGLHKFSFIFGLSIMSFLMLKKFAVNPLSCIRTQQSCDFWAAMLQHPHFLFMVYLRKMFTHTHALASFDRNHLFRLNLEDLTLIQVSVNSLLLCLLDSTPDWLTHFSSVCLLI